MKYIKVLMRPSHALILTIFGISKIVNGFMVALVLAGGGQPNYEGVGTMNNFPFMNMKREEERKHIRRRYEERAYQVK